MRDLKIYTVLIFIIIASSKATSPIHRELTTTVTGNINDDGHIYTLINNYGIWASIIIYALFWLLIFCAFFINYQTNNETYTPIAANSNRVNVELAQAKLQDPNALVTASPEVKTKLKDKDLLKGETHDIKALVYVKTLKISPFYSIYHSRTYSESIKKINLLVVNFMTILMFLSILYNSDRFDVEDQNELVLGLAILAVLISWPFKYLYGFMKEIIVIRGVSHSNYKGKSIFFWVLFQLVFWSFSIVTSYEMAFQSVENSKLWVASAFIGIFFDLLVFDPLFILISNICVFPTRSIWCIIKFNGYA